MKVKENKKGGPFHEGGTLLMKLVSLSEEMQELA